MPRNLVLFDLEWNIGYQPYTFNYHGVQQTLRGEIVEIGAVKIDEDANVLDTFSIHLRPRIFRKLQHHIAKVTGLTQADLDKGEPIVQGLRRFMQWCGPDAEFAEWGLDDVPVLKQNLFLCNRQETDFYLLLMPGDKPFKTKDLSAQIHSARLSFAKPEYMEKYLDITPGSVSVLGLMNDSEKKVQLLIDEDVMKEPYFGCHPCINTSSLKFTTEDLMQKIIPALEHEPVTVTLPVPE